jgi:hypothetical protein
MKCTHLACQEKIAEAIELLKTATSGLQTENSYNAYLICQLECSIGAGGWMTRDQTVGDLIDELSEVDCEAM